MWITCLILFILFMLDQISKYLAQVFQPSNVVAIPHFVTLDLNYNRGMAWGMLENNTWILVIISLIASIVLGYICTKNDWKKNKFLSFSITMTLAGCLGNLFDRLISVIPNLEEGRPGVVDMISFEPLNVISNWISKGDFPIFNLADAFLVCGLIIYAVDLLFFVEKRKKNEKRKDNGK